MKDLSTVSTDLYNKIRSRFSNIKIGDASANKLEGNDADISKARFFDLDYTVKGKSLGHVNIKLDEKKLIVIYNETMVDGENREFRSDWYDFLKELRMFAMSNMLKFDTRDITKTNLDKRDYSYLAQETGEFQMSEGKLWGTSKTSYQDVGEAKIIVKHSQPVNYDIPAGRTMHIDSIYIESANGERFRYPHRHLNGARAMAVHIANGGTSYDEIGTHISGLSEELSKLRQFKNYTQRNGLHEALTDISELVLTRIADIKEQIFKLQKQNYYSEFKESFKPSQDLPIPEETVNSWVDALTIRTFNEELKTVFPFIYKLTSQPKELSYEDLVAESQCKECGCDPCECEEEKNESMDMFNEFEDAIDQVTAFEYDMPEQTEVAPSPSTREIIEFIVSMYDQETGRFPKGEEGVKIAVEKRFGENAGAFADQVVERLAGNKPAEPDFNSMQAAIQEAADATSAGELEAAIKKFQQAAGIKVDGKYGPQTAKALQSAKAVPAKPADSAAPAAPQNAAAQAANVDDAGNAADPEAQVAASGSTVPNAPAAPQPSAATQAASVDDTGNATDPEAQAFAQPTNTAPAPKVTNQTAATNTAKQGNTTTTTTTASANIQGLDMNAARQTPEYQQILKSAGGGRQNVKVADMKYKAAIAQGKIKPPAPGSAKPAAPAPAPADTAQDTNIGTQMVAAENNRSSELEAIRRFAGLK